MMTASIDTARPPGQQAQTGLMQAGWLGDIHIGNRVVMAPLMRGLADDAGDLPGSDADVRYHAERSGAGLIICETAHVSPSGKARAGAPGMYLPAQVAGWRRIADAVHAAGTRIVAQIGHAGRVTHPQLTGGMHPVAPSAVAADVTVPTHAGEMAAPVPRALTPPEIAAIVAQFRQSAAMAMAAGFDGIEIDAGSGHLIDQFLRDGANRRTDDYGGSLDRRCRFALEVIDAVIAEAGPGRVGIRISPTSRINGLSDSHPQAVFGLFIEALNRRGIAYIHVIEGQTCGPRDVPGFSCAWARKHFRGAYIANNGYTRDSAMQAISEDHADAVSFGRAFVACPDLVERIRTGAPLTES